MKILIAYDGSNCSGEALAELRGAGLPAVAEALVLSVAERWSPPTTGFAAAAGVTQLTPEERESEALALAQQAALFVSNSFPAWQVTSEACAGSPATEIVKRAEAWGADLLVVGSHGFTAVERFVFGSVSQKVMHTAPCTVHIARYTRKAGEIPTRLVLGFDGSPDAWAAVRTLCDRVWPGGAEVRLLTSVGPLSLQTGINAEQEREHARSLQQQAERALTQAGLSVTSIIALRDPKHALMDEAKEWKADCIFVGASGPGRLKRWLLGSVSSAVAARAVCSVEVVRSTEDALAV